MKPSAPDDPALDALTAMLSPGGAVRKVSAALPASANLPSDPAVLNLSEAEISAVLDGIEEHEERKSALLAIYAETGPEPHPSARAIFDADHDKRRKRKQAEERAARRAAAKARAPKPYAALAGREKLTEARVIKEARSRHMQLHHATRAKGCPQFLVKLRGREREIALTWMALQFARIEMKCEPKPMAVASRVKSLARLPNEDDRRRQAARLLAYAKKLEAIGVWETFDVLAA